MAEKDKGMQDQILALVRQLEMREKRQAQILDDTRAQLGALKKQLGLV